MVDFRRILRHLFTGQCTITKYFPANTMQRIEQEIAQSEELHGGEIVFFIQHSLSFWDLIKGVTAKEAAIEAFSKMRVWDTEKNNGVLLFLLLADRDIEIIADRGINKLVGDAEWGRICLAIEEQFRMQKYFEGIQQGIKEIGLKLHEHFPDTEQNANELENMPGEYR